MVQVSPETRLPKDSEVRLARLETAMMKVLRQFKLVEKVNESLTDRVKWLEKVVIDQLKCQLL